MRGHRGGDVEVLTHLDFSKVLSACVVYAIGILALQFFTVAPARELLVQHIGFLRTRLAADDRKFEAYLAKVETSVGGKMFVLWGARVLAGWRAAHEVEVALARRGSADSITTRLETLADKLRAISGEDMETMADRIEDALDADAGKGESKPDLLQEGLSLLFTVRDGSYEEQASWTRKAVWLGMVGLALIALIAGSQSREIFLLMGAVGGFTSRITRVLKKQPKPTDYGASWSTLMLSPIAGALAGWLGLLIVGALADKPLAVLSETLDEVTWNAPTHPIALSLAFLCGFSERVFNKVVETAEGTMTKKLKGGAEKGDDKDEERNRGGRRNRRRNRRRG